MKRYSIPELDNYIKKLKETGYQVRAFIHCNPSNPLGEVYSEKATTSLMEMCKKHDIHFISDEIYAFSVHCDETIFKRQEIIDFS